MALFGVGSLFGKLKYIKIWGVTSYFLVLYNILITMLLLLFVYTGCLKNVDTGSLFIYIMTLRHTYDGGSVLLVHFIVS